MAAIGRALTGGFFPEDWTAPVAMGLGVVLTGFLGDTIAGFIGQFIPAEWLNPATEIVAGILFFFLGGVIGGNWSMWLRFFSLGAFAVGIADAITILLGLGAPAPAIRRVSAPAISYTKSAGVRTTPATRSNAMARY